MGDAPRKNVIVVGAGASKEFELPTGAELKHVIAQICDIKFDDFGRGLISGDHQVVKTLREKVSREDRSDRSISSYLHAAWRIRDNMPLAPSIDNFLDTHKENSELITIGKIAIAKAILEAEANSPLCVDTNVVSPQLNASDLRNTWIAQLFTILVAQRSFSDFVEAVHSITFISFNYDRCIHQFFAFASRDYFGLEEKETLEVLQALKVLYPYGSVGNFRWSGVGTNFGKISHSEILLKCASEIRTFTEGTASEVSKLISSTLSEAEVVLFMGFGFLRLNMEMLFKQQTFPGVRVIGTGKGMSENSRSQVIAELEHIFPNTGEFTSAGSRLSNVDVLDMTCSELIFEFQRFLSS